MKYKSEFIKRVNKITIELNADDIKDLAGAVADNDGDRMITITFGNKPSMYTLDEIELLIDELIRLANEDTTIMCDWDDEK